jgi:hypothetical protein
MLTRLGALAAVLLCPALVAAAPALEELRVAPGGRYFETRGGAPFFWLADTAWLVASRLERGEVLRYLDDRQRKGFNVIQVMALYSTAVASPAGVPALVGRDPSRPNEGGYWDHLEWIVDRAAERGMYVALVAVWGSVVKAGELNGRNAEAYVRFLVRRFGAKPNLVWVLGGDIAGDGQRELWVGMGHTLKRLDPKHLVTFHPFGRCQSSTWFHGEPWLDFNMFQSGHQDYAQDTKPGRRYGEDNWRYARDDWARTPAKPVIDAEPSYENIPHGLHDGRQPYWTDADARRYAWWSVFAGAAGHTYGDNAVMQFLKPGMKPSYAARNFWEQAIEDPGAGQMRHLKSLMLSRPYFGRVPAVDLVAEGSGPRYDYVAATRGPGYVMAYRYTGRPFALRMGVLKGRRLRAWWYNPRNGESRAMGRVANRGTARFTPPGESRAGNDWALVLDEEAAGFAPPGPVNR